MLFNILICYSVMKKSLAIPLFKNSDYQDLAHILVRDGMYPLYRILRITRSFTVWLQSECYWCELDWAIFIRSTQLKLRIESLWLSTSRTYSCLLYVFHVSSRCDQEPHCTVTMQLFVRRYVPYDVSWYPKMTCASWLSRTGMQSTGLLATCECIFLTFIVFN